MPRTFLVHDSTGEEVDLGGTCVKCEARLPREPPASLNRNKRTLYCDDCDEEYEVVLR